MAKSGQFSEKQLSYFRRDCASNSVTVSQVYNNCAAEEAAKSMDTLDETFSTTIKRITKIYGEKSKKTDMILAKFRMSQTTWRAGMEATCDFIGAFFEGGSSQPQFVFECETDLNLERKAFLDNLLNFK